MTERIGTAVLEAYCSSFGVQSRDVGVGLFHANASPLGQEKCQGMCVFDATHGSLRLTQRLGEAFPEVLEISVALAKTQDEPELAQDLLLMRQAVMTLEPRTPMCWCLCRLEGRSLRGKICDR